MRLLSLENRTPLQRLLMLSAMTSGGSVVEDTATGNPLVFTTDLARPLKSLLIPFTPIQSGTGDPSPEDIRPILPWDGLKVWYPTGVNRWDEQWEAGAYNALGNPVTGSNQIRSKNLIPVEPETEYYFYINANVNCRIYFCRENGSVISYSAYNKATFTTPAECKWLKFHTGAGYGETYSAKISINFPATETGYEPFETETDIVFPSPVYGGTLDVVSGVLTVTHGIKTITGLEGFNWRINGTTIYTTDNVFENIQLNDAFVYGVCNMTPTANRKLSNISKNSNTGRGIAFQNVVTYWGLETVSGEALEQMLQDFNTAGTPVTIAYELATPQEIQLTPAQLTALIGNNTIWSDAEGSMTAVYLKKG